MVKHEWELAYLSLLQGIQVNFSIQQLGAITLRDV